MPGGFADQESRSLPRPDAKPKAAGEARYTGDMALPRMLHGTILRSPLPHARILGIDASRALRLRGVRAVITGGDTLGLTFGGIATAPITMDRHPLAMDKVRYMGDEVAAVAAVDADTAREALSLIRIDYEPLPAVFDPLQALAEGAPLVHEGSAGNISRRHVTRAGDLDAAFGESAAVREGRFVAHSEAHAPMEPHVCLAQYDAAGKLTVWSSTQSSFCLQQDLARTLGLPDGRVRVIKPHVGGGFGGKADMDSLDFCASLLSMKTGCPVKIVYSREEDLIYTRRRHNLLIEMKTGVRKDGTLAARYCKVILDGGAYNSHGLLTTVVCSYWNLLPYRIPNYQYEGIRVYTNKAPGGPMRGHGSPQIHFAVESQMDMLAADLGMDPIELRLRNALEAGDRNPSNVVVRSSGFRECLKGAAERAGWQKKWGKLPAGRGIGVGCSGFVCGSSFHFRPTAAALSAARVVIEPDGRATLFTGAVDTGQGSDFTLVQIAAEELGLPAEAVAIVAADTEITPVDMGNFSSRTTVIAGNAVKRAAGAAKVQALKAAAELLEANADDLQCDRGRIFVKGSPERCITFAEAVRGAYKAGEGRPVVGEGSYVPPAGSISPSFSFSVQIAEVEVDPETGQVHVNEVTSAHDCGVAINPMSVEGQLEGSVYIGMGYALSEQLSQIDGQSIQTSFADYHVPTAGEMPHVAVVHLDVVDPEGPFGAKEAGEGTVGPTAPAIANAIFDATGVRLTELPLTPEKVQLHISEGREHNEPSE